MIRLAFLFGLIILSCSESKHTKRSLKAEDINSILSHIQENSPVYTEKGIAFDSIVTLAGVRSLDNDERLKMKLFFFGDHCRGYFNLADTDTKNLQFFGKKVEDAWALKCVTKLNMEEAGGYILLWKDSQDYSGIWSNGHVNFEKGEITLAKQAIDYNTLTVW